MSEVQTMHVCQQEIRIAKLEADSVGHNRDIQNLIQKLDGLTKGLWALVLTLIPVIIGAFAFLIVEFVKK
jgi:hypothetical protein